MIRHIAILLTLTITVSSYAEFGGNNSFGNNGGGGFGNNNSNPFNRFQNGSGNGGGGNFGGGGGPGTGQGGQGQGQGGGGATYQPSPIAQEIEKNGQTEVTEEGKLGDTASSLVKSTLDNFNSKQDVLKPTDKLPDESDAITKSEQLPDSTIQTDQTVVDAIRGNINADSKATQLYYKELSPKMPDAPPPPETIKEAFASIPNPTSNNYTQGSALTAAPAVKLPSFGNTGSHGFTSSPSTSGAIQNTDIGSNRSMREVASEKTAAVYNAPTFPRSEIRSR